MAARLRWLVPLAAVAVLALAAATGALSTASDLVVRVRTRIALERLIDALPPEKFPLARFSAISQQRSGASMRGPASLAPRVEAQAAKLLGISSGSSSPDVIAANAAAWAIRREVAKAVPLLEQAVLQAPGEARLWSDLAAAYLETNQPLRALVAADKALRIEPEFAPALQNRALALEYIGLAAVVKPALPSERSRWKALEKDFAAAAAGGDEEAVFRMFAECPGLARVYAEGVYLARWAEAVQTDPAEADRWLRVVRAMGRVLRRRGDPLVAESVAVIDGAIARGDSGTVARAYLAYDRGRRAYGRRDYAPAESELRDATALFRAARSPMEQVARSYTAALLFELARTDEAADILTRILARERSGEHRALLAHAEQQMALCNAHRGRWNEAAENATRSTELSHHLGETATAGESETMLAVVLDLVGQRERGWELRIRAFENMSAGGAPDRLLAAVGTGTRAAMRARDLELALSLLDVEMALAGSVRTPLLSADLFTRRALLQHERRDFDDRDTSIGRARAAIGVVADRNERDRLTVELDAAEAVFLRERDSARSVELLARGIQFCERTNRRIQLPTLLLQRGRTYLAAGDRKSAWQDFSTAIDTLDAQRGAIPDLKLRSRLLDTGQELFEEAIALQVREGDAEEAFRLAERARSRVLLDVLGGNPQPVKSSSEVSRLLAPETLLIEYAVLPDELVVFAIRHDGMRMDRVPVTRAALEAQAGLSATLLDAVRGELATARRLIVIPDGILQRVAFGALRWNGQFLVQSHVIAEAPSASRLAVASQRSEPKPRAVLVVGNPDPDPARDLEALPRVRREVAEIRAIHPETRALLGSDATRARFLADAAQYDVIHFAGHGLSGDRSITAALLFHGDGGGVATLGSADIAELRLRRAPLVVLSACGTLRGRVEGVEGMPSLARSFLTAGASAVVGTLTDVDDELVADLLTTFHRRIAAGVGPADALRDAQLEAIARGGEAAHPKNWAPFVLYGATP
ncbi:MAG TPA: CHAT domain-containing protein [Thermoanaerobaculia bacterium]|nr:CHAT domain-containing protein [Thermoanaerobaculia bacterium]